MTTPMEWHRETLGKKVCEALKKNKFSSEYFPTAAEARSRVLEMIAPGSSVGFGGSMTISALNVAGELEKKGCTILDHGKVPPEEKNAIRQKQLTCDCFLCSSNAVTMDGQLVNVDGTGNRVAAMIYGPKQVIVVAGYNKITSDLNSALERIEVIASPMNNKRLGYSNPCTVSGVCSDCSSDTRICNATTILHRKPTQSNIMVLVVGEDLGY